MAQETAPRAQEFVESGNTRPSGQVSDEAFLSPSYNQERFLALHEWHHHAKGQVPPPFHVVDAISIVGALNDAALEEALNRVIARHAGLRASFVPNPEISEHERHAGLAKIQTSGYPAPDLYRLLIARKTHVPLKREDGLRSQKEIGKLLQREALQPFDFAQAPLLRATLLDLGSDKHLLVLVAHHLIGDIISHRIVRREIQAFYEELVRGTDAGLRELVVHYPDFAAWQRQALPSSPSLEYWKKAWPLAEQGQLSYKDFPFALPQLPGRGAAPAYEEAHLEEKDLACLRSAAHSQGVALSCVFLAALGIVLHRWTRRPVVSVWNAFANRERPEILDSVGWFVNSHLLPLDFSGDPTLAEALERTRVALSDAARHQEIPSLLLCRTLPHPSKFTDLRIQLYFVEEETAPPPGPLAMTRLPLADLIRFRFPAGLDIVVIDRQTSLALMAGYFLGRFSELAATQLLQATARIAFMLLRESQAKVSAVSVTC